LAIILSFYSQWIHILAFGKLEKCLCVWIYCVGGKVITLDLNEAASFLKMNPEVLRRKARAGQVPGRKAGKCWIFVKEHLADWVSERYAEPRRGLQVIDDGYQPKEDIQPCRSINAGKTGGFNSPHRTASEYSALLGRK
jgi:hypothetical protein